MIFILKGSSTQQTWKTRQSLGNTRPKPIHFCYRLSAYLKKRLLVAFSIPGADPLSSRRRSDIFPRPVEITAI